MVEVIKLPSTFSSNGSFDQKMSKGMGDAISLLFYGKSINLIASNFRLGWWRRCASEPVTKIDVIDIGKHQEQPERFRHGIGEQFEQFAESHS
jgi:hypothetical protein